MNARDPWRTAAAPAWRQAGLMRSLGAAFSVAQLPQGLPGAHWVARNDALARELGWADWFDGDAALALLSGTAQPPGGTLATVYSGHQFGVWAGQLGDGRALLLGEADSAMGPVEVQLKGSGLTPYSRMGDGRAVLRSSIREYLCSEAMHALGIPTTRALALVGSPLPVHRETVETAAVVTRVAPSFLRFGHFEHFTHTAQDEAALKTLADATIERFYPALQGTAAPYAGLLEAVTRRTAALLAQWQAVGFCHGVMNTDNMSILGLTIDYGPFGFMDAFDPGHVCNHSDHQGRYAYARQPAVALWNLHALAQALLPLIDDSDAALAALEPYKTAYPRALLAALRAKLGLRAEREEDEALVDDLLRLMARDRADFTITFRRLATFGTESGAANAAVRDLFIDREAFDAWSARYAARLRAETSIDADRAAGMNRVNPKFVLRNHLAEAAIQRAREGDFSEVQRLAQVLQHPCDEQPEHEADAGLPPAWAQQLEVSCSS
ncbi:MAG: YdiU family protein [Rubrivivax sp.]|nr:YdiU family protein [Rubrivivax sp.]